VDLWDLIVTKHMSKHPKHYKQHVSQVIAAEQLMKEGAEIHAGNSIRFLFTHAEDKRHDRRVRAAQLIEKGTNPDAKKYLLLLYASASNLLSFAGFTTDSVYEAVTEQKQKTLTSFNSLKNKKVTL
jgi:DNA polymerase elongation subunit (family B)